MSDTLFHDKYTERALLNSPAVADSQNTPAYPDLMDKGTMRQKASDWYTQADALTSPDEDPDYETKLRTMGPAPTDAFGFAVDNNGEKLPDRNKDLSQQDRISTLTSVAPGEVESQNVQYAMDNHKKVKKAAYRDAVMTDLAGQRMEKDPISGVWRPPVPDYSKVFAAEKGAPLLSEEEIEAMPSWFDRKLTQVAGGGIDAMVNIGRTMAMGYSYILSRHGDKKIREKNEKIFSQLNDPNVDSYELLGGLGQDIKIEADKTLSGGLVRGFSQFLIPFTAGMRATSAMTKGIGYIRPLAVGFAADLTSSQASDGNLADLFIMLGADNEALKFMSASRSSSQFEAKLKIAVEGGIIGEGIGLAMRGGSWVLKKTGDKKALQATSDFLMNLSKAARRTNETQVAVIENDASEIIANHLLEQYDVQRAAPTDEVPRGVGDGEPGEIPAGKEGVQKPEDGAPEPAKPEEKPEQPPKPVYAPSQEVREAYSQYALAKILKDDMTPEDWLKSMKGKGHPELLKQSYEHAKNYINNDGRAMAYYHRTERAVIETPDTKKGRTADQWLQEIEGASKGKGTMGKLPADIRPNVTDMKWLGVDSFLKENKGKKVTKDELIQHIRANRVEIQDIDKGAGMGVIETESPEYLAALNDAEDQFLPVRMSGDKDGVAFADFSGENKYEVSGSNDEGWVVTDPDGDEVFLPDYAQFDEGQLEEVVQQHAKDYSFFDEEEAANQASKSFSAGEPPRHEEHIEPGEYTDYNEILLTMPKIDVGVVEPTHFKEENVIVHARFNTRTDKSGAEVMFIEEIQSDYAKKGRTKGYESQKLTDQSKVEEGQKKWDELTRQQNMALAGHRDAKKELAELKMLKEVEDVEAEIKTLDEDIVKTENKIKFIDDEIEKLEKEIKKVQPQLGEGQIPDAPVKTTGQWAGMAMRRMIRYAVDNGQKKIAWITGDMQAKRSQREAAEAKGFRDIYDIEIPNSVKKYVKQWKGKITTTEINVGSEAEPEWQKVMAVEFPEEMVKSARGGVPLLQLTPGVMAPAVAAGQLLEVEGEDDQL